MGRLYIDTVTIRFEFPKHSIQRVHANWWGKRQETYKGQSVTSWYMKQDHITLRCFDCFVNGKAILSVTCSVPKVVHGNNYNYIDDSEIGIFFSRLDYVIQQNIKTPTRINILQGQISRADPFYMHPIQPELREVYHNAYACLQLGDYSKVRYINTNNLTSKPFYYEKGNPATVVYRNYDKDVEAYERNNPKSVHDDFEDSQNVEYTPPGYRRFEAQLLRPKLKKIFGKSSVTLLDVMNPTFQVQALDSFFKAVKLYDQILPAKEFRQRVPSILPTAKTQDNAVHMAHHIRNHRTPKLTKHERRHVMETLRNAGVHYVTTPDAYNGITIPPLSPINRDDLYNGAASLNNCDTTTMVFGEA